MVPSGRGDVDDRPLAGRQHRLRGALGREEVALDGISGVFHRASLKRVSTIAGAMAFTRTPEGPSSLARTRVSMITAAFETE
jgi:hypothetical protein